MTSLRTSLKASLGFAALAGLFASASLGEGGANPAAAVFIPDLPFTDTGSTAGGTDDWDEACPFTGSTSPDDWYIYYPLEYGFVSIALCESSYDTKLYVLDASFTQIACVDDSCSSSDGGGFRSSIENLHMTGGNAYYIVIDGWEGDSGTYDFVMDHYQGPPHCHFGTCPDTLEGEPCDDSAPPDTFNGGCDSTPAVFSSVDCGQTICGTAWGFDGRRDTDWYEVTNSNCALVVQTIYAESVLQIVALTGITNGVCGDVGESQSLIVYPCVEGSLFQTGGPGQIYFWVGHSDFNTLPCGSENPGNDYLMTITCASAPMSPCCDRGDADEDSLVGFADLLILLSNWGSCGTPPCCTLGDSNEDGDIGFADLLILLSSWGPCFCL